MRLIDADILIAILQTELNKGVYVKNTLETFIEVLQQCPTAYDVEKVVEELERQAEQERNRGFECEQKGYSAMADKHYGKYCSYEYATEIVRKGGVE